MTDDKLRPPRPPQQIRDAIYASVGDDYPLLMLITELEAAIEAEARATPKPAPDVLLAEGIEAFRLTREYVGEDLLPALPGWAWFDWCERVRTALADTDR